MEGEPDQVNIPVGQKKQFTEILQLIGNNLSQPYKYGKFNNTENVIQFIAKQFGLKETRQFVKTMKQTLLTIYGTTSVPISEQELEFQRVVLTSIYGWSISDQGDQNKIQDLAKIIYAQNKFISEEDKHDEVLEQLNQVINNKDLVFSRQNQNTIIEAITFRRLYITKKNLRRDLDTENLLLRHGTINKKVKTQLRDTIEILEKINADISDISKAIGLAVMKQNQDDIERYQEQALEIYNKYVQQYPDYAQFIHDKIYKQYWDGNILKDIRKDVKQQFQQTIQEDVYNVLQNQQTIKKNIDRFVEEWGKAKIQNDYNTFIAQSKSDQLANILLAHEGSSEDKKKQLENIKRSLSEEKFRIIQLSTVIAYSKKKFEIDQIKQIEKSTEQFFDEQTKYGQIEQEIQILQTIFENQAQQQMNNQMNELQQQQYYQQLPTQFRYNVQKSIQKYSIIQQQNNKSFEDKKFLQQTQSTIDQLQQVNQRLKKTLVFTGYTQEELEEIQTQQNYQELVQFKLKEILISSKEYQEFENQKSIVAKSQNDIRELTQELEITQQQIKDQALKNSLQSQEMQKLRQRLVEEAESASESTVQLIKIRQEIKEQQQKMIEGQQIIQELQQQLADKQQSINEFQSLNQNYELKLVQQKRQIEEYMQRDIQQQKMITKFDLFKIDLINKNAQLENDIFTANAKLEILRLEMDNYLKENQIDDKEIENLIQKAQNDHDFKYIYKRLKLQPNQQSAIERIKWIGIDQMQQQKNQIEEAYKKLSATFEQKIKEYEQKGEQEYYQNEELKKLIQNKDFDIEYLREQNKQINNIRYQQQGQINDLLYQMEEKNKQLINQDQLQQKIKQLQEQQKNYENQMQKNMFDREGFIDQIGQLKMQISDLMSQIITRDQLVQERNLIIDNLVNRLNQQEIIIAQQQRTIYDQQQQIEQYQIEFRNKDIMDIQISDLNQQIKIINETNRQLTEQIDINYEQINKQQEQIKQQQIDIDNAKQMIENLEVEKQSNNKRIERQTIDAQNQIKNLQEQIKNLKENENYQKNQLKAQLENQQKFIQQIQENAKKENGIKDQQIEKLQIQIDSSQIIIQQLKEQLQQQNQQISEQIDKQQKDSIIIKQLNEQINDQQKQLKQSEEQINNFNLIDRLKNSEIIALSQKIKDQTSSARRMEEQITRLMKLNQEIEQKIKDEQINNQEKQELIIQLEQNKIDIQDNQQKLLKKNQELEKQLEQQKEIKKQLAEYAKTIGEQKKIIEQSAIQIKDLTKTKDKIQEQYEKNELLSYQQKNDYQKEIQKLDKQIEQLQDKIQQLEKYQNTYLKDKLQQKQQINELEQQKQKLQNDINDIRKKYKESELKRQEELSKYKDDISQLNNQIIKLQADKQQAEQLNQLQLLNNLELRERVDNLKKAQTVLKDQIKQLIERKEYYLQIADENKMQNIQLERDNQELQKKLDQQKKQSNKQISKQQQKIDLLIKLFQDDQNIIKDKQIVIEKGIFFLENLLNFEDILDKLINEQPDQQQIEDFKNQHLDPYTLIDQNQWGKLLSVIVQKTKQKIKQRIQQMQKSIEQQTDVVQNEISVQTETQDDLEDILLFDHKLIYKTRQDKNIDQMINLINNADTIFFNISEEYALFIEIDNSIYKKNNRNLQQIEQIIKIITEQYEKYFNYQYIYEKYGFKLGPIEEDNKGKNNRIRLEQEIQDNFQISLQPIISNQNRIEQILNRIQFKEFDKDRQQQKTQKAVKQIIKFIESAKFQDIKDLNNVIQIRNHVELYDRQSSQIRINRGIFQRVVNQNQDDLDKEDFLKIIAIYMGLDGDKFNNEEEQSFEKIIRRCQQFQSYRNRVTSQQINSQDLFKTYDQFNNKVVDEFSIILKRWIQGFYYDEQRKNNNFRLKEVEVPSILQSANFLNNDNLIVGLFEHDTQELILQFDEITNQITNTRLRTVIPVVSKGIGLKNYSINRFETINLEQQKLNLYRKIYVEITKDIQSDFFANNIQLNQYLQMLDGQQKEDAIHNIVGVQNRIQIILTNKLLNTKLQYIQFKQQHDIQEQNYSEELKKKFKYFPEFEVEQKYLYDEDIAYNRQQQYNRLHISLISRYRTISKASRMMICNIITMLKFMIKNLFDEDIKQILQQMFFPEIQNDYYIQYGQQPIQKDIYQFPADQQMNIIMGGYPLIQTLSLCDKVLLSTGQQTDIEQTKVNDFITTKVFYQPYETYDTQQTYFIHQNTMVFNNLLQQSVIPFKTKVTQYGNKQGMNYLTFSLYQIIINHLTYRVVKHFPYFKDYQQESNMQNYFKILDQYKNNLEGYDNNKMNIKQQVVIELAVGTILDNLIDNTKNFLAKEVKLNSEQNKVGSFNKRYDQIHQRNTIYILIDMKSLESQQLLIQQKQTDVDTERQALKQYCEQIVYQILQQYEKYIEQKELNKINNILFERIQIFFNPINFYQQIDKNVKEIQFKQIKEQKIVDIINENDKVQSKVSTNVNDSDNYNFILKHLFTGSEGLNFSQAFSKQYYEKDQDKFYEEYQQLRVSYICVERMMITSLSQLDKDEKNDHNTSLVDQLRQMSKMLIGYKYFNINFSMDNTRTAKLFTKTGEEQEVYHGIKFFMKEVWQNELPNELQYKTSLATQYLQNIHDFNCAVICYMGIVFYALSPKIPGVDFNEQTFRDGYFEKSIKYWKMENIVNSHIIQLKTSPQFLLQFIEQFNQKCIKNDMQEQVNLCITKFNHEMVVDRIQTFGVKHKEQNIDQLNILIWKQHAELFNNGKDFDDVYNYVKMQQKGRGGQILRDKIRPINHEDRVSEYQKHQKNEDLLIFYDMETQIKESMIPYMIVFCLFSYNIEPEILNNIKNQLMIINDKKYKIYQNQIFYYLDVDQRNQPDDICRQFIQQISLIQTIVKQNVKVHVIAHNGGRFDNVILLPYIFKHFGHLVQIFGEPNNIKMVSIDKQNLVFEDSMQQTQLGSLNQACGPKGLDLKLQKIDLGEIKHLDYWYEYINHKNKVQLLDYCIQDVFMLQQLIIQFNKTIIEMVQQIYQERNNKILGDNKQYFCLKTSLSSTSYEFFMNYFIPSKQDQIETIKRYTIYRAVKQSQHGGRTSCFHYGEFQNKQIHDQDITSSYPNQMVKHIYCTELEDEIFLIQKGDSPNYIRPLNLYGITYFNLGSQAIYGYIPVKCQKKGVLFYPLEWGDQDFYIDENNRKNMDVNQYIQLLFTSGVMEQKTVWIWGFQLLSIYQLFSHQTNFKIVINMIIRCKKSGQPFQAVQNMFNMRLQAKQQNKTALQQALKLFMNGFYGTMGMKDYPQTMYIDKQLIVEEHEGIQPQKNDEIKAQIKSQILKGYAQQFSKSQSIDFQTQSIQIKPIEGTHMFQMKLVQFGYLPQNQKSRLVHMVSQITAHAMEQLNLSIYYMKQAFSRIDRPFTMIYCDTDSMYYETPGIMNKEIIEDIMKEYEYQHQPCQQTGYIQQFQLRIGNELGQWNLYDNSLKKPYVNFQVFGKKFYYGCFGEDDPEQKKQTIRIKGANNNYQKNREIIQQMIKDGQAKQDFIQWKRSKLCIQQIPITKMFTKKNNYSELVFNDGSTYPFQNQQQKNDYLNNI